MNWITTVYNNSCTITRIPHENYSVGTPPRNFCVSRFQPKKIVAKGDETYGGVLASKLKIEKCKISRIVHFHHLNT